MSEYLIQTPQETSDLFIGENALGRGGEGSVYEVKGHAIDGLPDASTLVAKLYHAPDEDDRFRKIIAMIKHTPESDSLAWPLALVLKNGEFAGYVMRKLPKDSYRMWAELAHAQQRRESADKFDVRYALTAALNCALTLSSVHDAGHMVGDVNESNIFIGSDASVLLVDTDSAQISSGNKVFPCLVGKPEYTAAELSHGSLKTQTRTEASDTFAYSVAIYQLLTGGAHPMDGVYEGEGEPPSVVEKIRAGITPNFKKVKNFAPVKRVPTQGIPSRLRMLILRGVQPDPAARPEMYEFEDSIDEILDNLQHCSKVKQHWFDKRDKKCGWCDHVKEGNLDPWVMQAQNLKKVKKAQKTLPSIKFNEGEKTVKKAPRVKIGASPMGSVTSGSVSPSAAVSPSGGPMARLTGSNASGGLQQPLSQVYKSKRIELPKEKGTTILQYADGSQDKRPALGQLIQVKPKIAYRCFVNEVPDNLRPSWKFNDSLPDKKSLWVSVVVALIISAAWLALPLTYSMVPIEKYTFMKSVLHYLPYACVATSAGFVLLKTFFTFNELRKINKVAGQYNIPHASPLTTFVRLPIGALFYGLPFLITLFVGVSLSILSVILGAVKQSK